jgi:serine/threonine protein kinase
MVMDWGVAKSMAAGDPASREAVTAGTALDRVAACQPKLRATRGFSEGWAETEAGAVIGTRGFMAPEQARGDTRDLDERTDVYALGAILLALLTGRDTGSAPLPPPEALERAPSIPRPLWSVCTRALAARPDDRYVSASALREDVARYRAGQAVHAHRETAFERTARLAKVYRTPILLVVAYMIMRALFALAVGRG